MKDKYPALQLFRIIGKPIVVTCLLATTVSSMADSISVNFGIVLNDANAVDAGETSLAGISGAESVDGSVWNNVLLKNDGYSGSPAALIAATQGGSHINLTDSTGSDSGVDMTSSGSFYANFGNSSMPSQTSTGDAGLMQSYLNLNNTESVTLTGLAAWAPKGYKVYAVFDIGIVTRTYAVSMGDGTTGQMYWTFDTTGTDADSNNDGVMEWLQTSATTSGSAVTDANYAEFGIFTGNTLTISGDATVGRGTLSGFQIVALSEEPASIVSFTATPDTFAAGESVTLSWEVSGADSVSIDQGVGVVSATNTIDVTPGDTTTWTLSATKGATLVAAKARAALDKGPVDVYLLGGQSNMQGLGELSELTAEQLLPATNVFYWNGGGFEPLIPGTTVTAGSGQFGPEIAFATHSAKPNRKVFLIKYYNSGKPLDAGWNDQTWIGDPPAPNRVNFYPGTTSADSNQGSLYKNHMLPKFLAGLADLADEGYTPVIRGFVWMQGEQDSKNATSAGRYAENLKRLRDRLAEDLSLSNATDLPITFGQVLPYAPAAARFVSRDLIRSQQASADMDSGHTNAIPRCRMVSTDGYSLKADTVHYDTNGQIQLGTDFASGIQEAAFLPTPSVALAVTGMPHVASLSWTGQYGKIYGVETSTNLVDGTWDRVMSDFAGTNGTININDTATRDQAFYRVIIE